MSEKTTPVSEEKDPNSADDEDLLVNAGIQNPAFWFFILAIPIVISLYLTFVRSAPVDQAPQVVLETSVPVKEKVPAPPRSQPQGPISRGEAR